MCVSAVSVSAVSVCECACLQRVDVEGRGVPAQATDTLDNTTTDMFWCLINKEKDYCCNNLTLTVLL